MTASGSRTTRRKWRLLAASVAVLVVAADCVSVAEGTPRMLPGVALGSPVLLHAERVLALVGVVVAAVSVLAQAARGRLPIELSTTGLRYEAEAADDTAAAVAQLQDQFDDLVATVDALAGRLDLPQRRT
jgi:hypothetical protein